MSETPGKYYTRRELSPLNCGKDLTSGRDGDRFSGELNNECEMCNEIDRLTSRHIAKLLTKLGSTIPPVVEQEIKRQFRFLSEDIKTSVTGESHDQDDSAGNR
jgi:hypothetical protein